MLSRRVGAEVQKPVAVQLIFKIFYFFPPMNISVWKLPVEQKTRDRHTLKIIDLKTELRAVKC